LLAVVLVVGFTNKQECCYMAIDFGTGGTKGIEYGAITQLADLSQKSVSVWLYYSAERAPNSYSNIVDKYTSGKGWSLYILNKTSATAYPNHLFFVQTFSGSNYGQWYLPEDTLAAGNRYHIVITYDRSSTDNDPVFYVNGTVVASTEELTPAETAESDATYPLSIGGSVTESETGLLGTVSDVRIYNRILTAAEVLDIYTSKSYDSVPRGLVFQMRGYGCAGKQTFEGATLGAANIVRDYISGAAGTPAGSPIGRGDTFLSCNP
jgi:hypothetical protein